MCGIGYVEDSVASPHRATRALSEISICLSGSQTCRISSLLLCKRSYFTGNSQSWLWFLHPFYHNSSPVSLTLSQMWPLTRWDAYEKQPARPIVFIFYVQHNQGVLTLIWYSLLNCASAWASMADCPLLFLCLDNDLSKAILYRQWIPLSSGKEQVILLMLPSCIDSEYIGPRLMLESAHMRFPERLSW